MGKVVLFASLVFVACGGKAPAGGTAPAPGAGSTPIYIKKVAVGWSFKKAETQTEVYATLTDETGASKSYPAGRYDGECQVTAPRPTAKALTVATCGSNGTGVELHAVARAPELILLKFAVAPGSAFDPMAGLRIDSIPIPADAKIEANQ